MVRRLAGQPAMIKVGKEPGTDTFASWPQFQDSLSLLYLPPQGNLSLSTVSSVKVAGGCRTFVVACLLPSS
jgi:hypothetical protein